MTKRPGQDSGHAQLPATFTWGDYLEGLVEQHGSLAAVALKLVALRGFVEEAGSVERGLRRLRGRGQLDGGDWGRRLLAAFGMPQPVEERVRWMGLYHSRFTDLPGPLCREQLRLWDRPPVSESHARIWPQLGLAHLALRGRQPEEAERHLQQARAAAAHASPLARVELALVEAYRANGRGERPRAQALLAEAGALLDSLDTAQEDGACLHARWVDQCAFLLNNPAPGEEADPRGALALYERIATDAPPFARCRRESGLAFARWRLGEREAALAHAQAASRAAGDGGSLRLRVMALKLLGRIQGGEEGERTRQRAAAIAQRLEDQELLFRTRPREDSAG